MIEIKRTVKQVQQFKCMICGARVEYCFQAGEPSDVQRFECRKCGMVYNLWGLNVTDAHEVLMAKKQRAMKKHMKEQGICETE